MSEEINNLKKDIIFLYDSQKALLKEFSEKILSLEHDVKNSRKELINTIQHLEDRIVQIEKDIEHLQEHLRYLEYRIQDLEHER